MLTPGKVLNELTKMFAGFAPVWDSPENCFLNDDGSFTYHGLFSEFGVYVRDNFGGMEERKREELFDFIELCVSDVGRFDEGLDKAVCTCFLENLSNESLSPEFRKYMGRKSLEFFNVWDYSERRAAT
jgi:hypothetical protein